MENKKKVNIGWIISGVFLLVLLISASFAYFGMFTVNLENKMAVNIHASTIGNTSFIATSANLNVIVPTSGMFKGNTGLAAENTATLTVNLTGAPDVLTTCTYDVVYEYDLDSEIYGSTVNVTSGATKEITLEVSSPSGTNNYASETNFAYDSTWTPKTSTVGAKKTLVKNAVIVSQGTSVVQSINIIGRYYNLEVEQTQLGNKSFTGKIYVENNNCSVGDIPEKASELILALNGGKDVIEAKDTPDFTMGATTNEGMYVGEDGIGTSYYFRGAVDNNWLKFGKYSQDFIKYIGYYSTTSSEYITYDTLEECNSASSFNVNCTETTIAKENDDIYWRIVRINGDGSIRLIYTGTIAPKESEKVVMTGPRTQIGTSNFNNNKASSEYVGYKYEIGKQHGLANDSTVKTYLENWYQTTTLNTNVATKKFIIDSPFCYDRTASTSVTGTYGDIDNWVSTGTQYYYGSYGRLNANELNLSLKCANELDKYSVANGALFFPVGLITIDEMVFAGLHSDNNSYYLYTGKYYWSGTPTIFTNGYSLVFLEPSSSTVSSYYVDNSLGVRPVISLSSEAKLSGDGTWNNPYTVNLS